MSHSWLVMVVEVCGPCRVPTELHPDDIINQMIMIAATTTDIIILLALFIIISPLIPWIFYLPRTMLSEV